MSKSGKILRGMKWHKFRDLDGVYLEDITDDPHKMEELNFYLDFVKTRDKEKVHKILEKIMLCDLQNKESLREEAAKELEDPSLLVSEKKKVEKTSSKSEEK